jgi:thiol-disulfide isomerase/thioredoxin
VRVVPCVIILGCLVALSGCGLLRNQSGGETKRPLFGAKDPPKQKNPPATPPQPDDPLLKSSNNGDLLTTLAGQVVDVTNTPLTHAYVRITCLDATGAKEAAIDQAVDTDGFFGIHTVKPGKRYKLEARAMQSGKLVATTAQVTAPNPTLHLILKAENVLPDTPPLPPPPGLPIKPKNKNSEGANDKNKNAKTPTEGVGFGQAPAKQGFSMGPPLPAGDKPAQSPGPGWTPGDNTNVPKYPENIVKEGFDPSKPPPLKSKPWNPGDATAPTPDFVQPKGGAYVPSCLFAGNRLINFALPDFYGASWEWKTNRLGRVVLLDFWRTNCPPCREAIDNLRSLQAKYGSSGLEVIGIAAENQGTLDEQRARIATICQLKQTNYRMLLASGINNPVLHHLDIQALPTLILLDAQGNILWRHQGGMNEAGWRTLDSQVQLQLAK